MRMNDNRYPRIALLGGVHRIRQRGRTHTQKKKHWVDSIEEDCRNTDMAITQASRTAQDRNNWRTAMSRLPTRA